MQRLHFPVCAKTKQSFQKKNVFALTSSKAKTLHFTIYCFSDRCCNRRLWKQALCSRILYSDKNPSSETGHMWFIPFQTFLIPFFSFDLISGGFLYLWYCIVSLYVKFDKEEKSANGVPMTSIENGQNTNLPYSNFNNDKWNQIRMACVMMSWSSVTVNRKV